LRDIAVVLQDIGTATAVLQCLAAAASVLQCLATTTPLTAARHCDCYYTLQKTARYCNVFRATMGGLRLVDSLKLLVSFVKESYKRDDILQKRPLI